MFSFYFYSNRSYNYTGDTEFRVKSGFIELKPEMLFNYVNYPPSRSTHNRIFI